MSARPSSLRRLLTIHESALLLTVLVAGSLAGLWAYYWQRSSLESLRLNELTHSAQLIRSGLFRQIKDAAFARLMEDTRALDQYQDHTQRIESHFQVMQSQARVHSEHNAIKKLKQTYRVIHGDMNKIFTDPYALRVIRLRILNPAAERKMVGDFDRAFTAFEALIAAQHAQLSATKERWLRMAPVLVILPMVAALGIFLLSRRRLQQRFVAPVERIISGANYMRQGELDHRIPAHGVAEVAGIAQALNELARDLALSRDALVEKEKVAALGALVPVIAHNIRNPLATIRANVQVLEADDSAAEYAETKHAVLSTVDRLNRWVTALVSYMHPLNPQRRETRIADVVETVLAMLRERIEDKQLTLSKVPWDPMIALPLDRDLYEQALYGLINNAIEASPVSGRVQLELRVERSQVVLAIIDQGPGFPFEPHPTDLSPGPTTKRHGTGLGIPLAFKICKCLGWRLTFQNRSASGAQVEIAMPLERTQNITPESLS